MSTASPQPSAPATPTPVLREVPFGVNEVRLNTRQWLIVLGIVALAVLLVPRTWKFVERFETGPDYRIPYQLSQDYWLFERRLHQVSDTPGISVLGDSVIWGEYVLPDGTLSHFLNRESGQTDRFVNCGVNGMFPLALDGLVNYYAGALRHRKVLLQCNLLWMSSPKADLQIEKEEKFNHASLVPQFWPRLHCYKADSNQRLTALVERNLGLVAWVNHLQCAYFDAKSILNWTLQDDGGDPPRYPNAGKNPLAQIKLAVPSPPANDPQRGLASPRHKSWLETAGRASQFEWVEVDSSLQWGAFKRLVNLLRERGNEVFVIVGPFNEHMIAEESRPAYRKLHAGIAAWLTQNQVRHSVPELLPSALYADGSHPLTAGYELLAKQLFQNPAFQQWLNLNQRLSQ